MISNEMCKYCFIQLKHLWKKNNNKKITCNSLKGTAFKIQNIKRNKKKKNKNDK